MSMANQRSQGRKPLDFSLSAEETEGDQQAADDHVRPNTGVRARERQRQRERERRRRRDGRGQKAGRRCCNGARRGGREREREEMVDAEGGKGKKRCSSPATTTAFALWCSQLDCCCYDGLFAGCCCCCWCCYGCPAAGSWLRVDGQGDK